MRILAASLLGFLLDLLIGDPESLSFLHPVVLMGKAISFLEAFLRRLFPKTAAGEKFAGMLLALFLPAAVFFCSRGILWLLQRLWQPLAFVVEVIWCAQALAVKNLKDEAMRVHRALTSSTLEESRKAVSRIVGRNTRSLDRAGVIRATVETVAENFSDGVIAPMAFMLLGGAPLSLCYKAVNTMDSMLGYKNERYLHFGCFPARLDDVANFLPSRIAALLLIAAAALTGENASRAFQIWKRDHRKHESPNSAQCESVMAGALGVRLCGPAVYFGQVKQKPYLGDDLRPVDPGDIPRACRMELTGSFLGIALFCLIRLLFVILQTILIRLAFVIL
ncbi:MAG: cobalamin biosynthesis protein CobD [Oscillospiraceae bacterium]|nr:cobalamin biosynthesis protein CobD [Oscillospiraceae bacterium]